VARPKHSLNVTERERDAIRRLYLRGLRIVDIVERSGRSESVVMSTVRGLKRPRPRPASTKAVRNALMVKLRKEGLTYVAIGKLFGISATTACQTIRFATGRRKKKLIRTERSELPEFKAARPKLARAQVLRREGEIARLWAEGVTEAALAARFEMTEAAVRRVALRRLAVAQRAAKRPGWNGRSRREGGG